MALTKNQRTFIEEYLIDLNAQDHSFTSARERAALPLLDQEGQGE